MGGKTLVKNTLVLSVIASLLCVSVIPSSVSTDVRQNIVPLSSGNTLYVGGSGPNNYTSIQDAIDNASDGDTVFVYDDSSPYYENIIIDKSISLIGEDKNTTVIDGDDGAHVIKVSADYVNITRFLIQHIYFDTLESGIAIQNSNNNTIIDNKIRSNFYGIWLISSSGNTIMDNSISYSEVILLLEESNNNIISGNSISHSYNWGKGIIFSDSSSNNTIIDNTISDNLDGISLWNSDNNIISGNIISDNHYSGLYLYNSSSSNVRDNSFYNDGMFIEDSYQNNVSNNTINDKPLVYLEEESDMVIDEGAGQVILVSCNNITIKNLDISNINSGIVIWGTNNSKIANNNCYDNNRGISISHSNNNNITDNNLLNNNGGLNIDYSENNIFSDNNISNIFSGVRLGYSNNNTFIGNNISDNHDGLSLGGSNGNIITGNIILNNSYQGGNGISLSGWLSCCKNNIITGNLISGNGDGIYLTDSDSNLISKNNILDNSINGIYLWRSSKNIITNNNITSNIPNGILLKHSSDNNKITVNNISNNGYGINCIMYFSSRSNNNSIFHNNFINNSQNAHDECNNFWNDKKMGNYWSDYDDRYPDAKPRLLKPWVWDTPYEILGGNNTDRYPLINQWPNSVSKSVPKNQNMQFGWSERFPLLQRLLGVLGRIYIS